MAIYIDPEEFIAKWAVAIQKKDDKQLYLLLLKIYKQIPIDAKAKDPKEPPFFRLIPFLKKEIPQILDQNFEKSSQIRKVLKTMFSRAFSEKKDSTEPEMEDINPCNAVFEGAELDTKIPGDEKSQSQSSTQGNDSESQNKSEPGIVPQDTQGSEFFKGKIRRLVEENLVNILKLFENKQFSYQSELVELLSYLIGLFGDAPEVLVQPLLKLFEKGQMKDDFFISLLKKCLDKSPSPIIFAVVNTLQELMTQNSVDPLEIHRIEIILDIFGEYVQYYPDYFNGHVNLYIGLIGRFSERITIAVSEILFNYAKLGDEALNELFFELYRRTKDLSENDQMHVIKVMRECFSVDAPFILEKNYQEKMAFDPSVLKQLKVNMQKSSKELQEFSFEVAIAMWKYEVQIELIPSEGSVPNRTKILKPIVSILKDISKLKVYSPFLFMQAIRDIDGVSKEIQPDYPERNLENQFILEENFKSPEKYFQTLENLLLTLK